MVYQGDCGRFQVLGAQEHQSKNHDKILVGIFIFLFFLSVKIVILVQW